MLIFAYLAFLSLSGSRCGITNCIVRLPLFALVLTAKWNILGFLTVMNQPFFAIFLRKYCEVNILNPILAVGQANRSHNLVS